MNRKISFILSYWWCMLLLVLGLIPVCLGSREGTVSEKENRTLQGRPAFSIAAWFDGSYMSQLEAFLSDQMIGRDGILSASQNILGLFDATTEEERILNNRMDEELDRIADSDQEEADGFEMEPDGETEEKQGGISVEIVLNNQEEETAAAAPTLPPTPEPSSTPDSTPSGNAAASAPTTPDPAVKNLSTVRRFELKKADGSTSLLFQFGESAMSKTIASLEAYKAAVPETGRIIFTYVPYSYDANKWLFDTGKYVGWQSSAEATLQANVTDRIYIYSTVNELEPYMQAGEQCFYKTDHHWSGLGAFYMQRLMMNSWGIPSTAYEDFTYTIHEEFRGSISSEVGSRLYDRLEVPDALAPAHAYEYKKLNVLVREVRYMEPERSSYSAFLGGTHGPFYVAETGFHTGHSALVICDSFGNAFVPYIAPYYDRVCLADLRENNNKFVNGGGAKLREYIKYYGIDDVYFIVSRGTGINSSYMQSVVRKYL